MKNKLPLAILVFCCGALVAQTKPAAKPNTTKPAQAPTTKSAPSSAPAAASATPAAQVTAPGANVDPKATVITVTGLCAPGAPPTDCTRSISKDEFEKLLSALSPNIPAAQHRSIAGLYVQLLAMANQGEKLGADKDPSFEERMKLERLRLLAQTAERKMQESTKPSDEELQTFYTENSSKFEQLALRRITVPKTVGKGAAPVDTKTLVEQIQKRAAAGEDPDKLQSEVWVTTKATGAPPSTSQGLKRRGMMDPRHEAQIVQLKAGEVSSVIEDGQSYYIYKVDSRRTIPFKEVEKDIAEFEQQQRFQEKMRQTMAGVKADLNEAYFGPPPPPPTPSQAVPGKPQAQQPPANPQTPPPATPSAPK